MTVFSWTRSSSIAAAQWDTDLVKREDRWCLLELSTAEIETELASLDRPNFGSGTMVCWDGIYSLEEAEDKYGAERIVAALVSDLQSYIGLHFHRFIIQPLHFDNGVRPSDRPFHAKHSGYFEGQEEVVRSKKGKIVISHNLPRIAHCLPICCLSRRGKDHWSRDLSL